MDKDTLNALRSSITLGEHIDAIILQDYNNKVPGAAPPPGLPRGVPPKEPSLPPGPPGIPRRKFSCFCFMHFTSL